MNNYNEGDNINESLTDSEEELLSELDMNLDELEKELEIEELDINTDFDIDESELNLELNEGENDDNTSLLSDIFDDSSDSVFDEFFGDSDLFKEKIDNDLDSMLQIPNNDTNETSESNDKLQDKLWHDYMDDEKIFTNPDEVIQNAVDFTTEDFERVTDDILIISGVTESFEVKALKALTDQPRNKEFGSSCFISFNDNLIEIGKLEICLDTFLYLFDLWDYDIYMLSKTEDGRVQTKVDLDFIGLLLV